MKLVGKCTPFFWFSLGRIEHVAQAESLSGLLLKFSGEVGG